MASFSKATWLETWDKVRADLSHAFAPGPSDGSFSSEDDALLRRVADAVVARKLAAPTLVFLESLGPMNFLGSQALHVCAPILDMALNAQDVARMAVLLERRGTVPRLISFIEAASSPQGAEA